MRTSDKVWEIEGRGLEILSTIDTLEEFKRSTVYIDIRTILEDWLVGARDELELESDVKVAAGVRGSAKALRQVMNLLEILPTLVEGEDITRRKDRNDVDRREQTDEHGSGRRTPSEGQGGERTDKRIMERVRRARRRS